MKGKKKEQKMNWRLMGIDGFLVCWITAALRLGLIGDLGWKFIAFVLIIVGMPIILKIREVVEEKDG